jgi:hypothetical protein
VKDDAIGSYDLFDTLDKLSPGLTKITDDTPEDSPDVDQNRCTALRLFHGLLYSRLLIFRVFIECAADLPGGIQDKHKGEWLFLQLAPVELLESQQDIFHDLAIEVRSFEGLQNDTLRRSSREELTRIHNLLHVRPTCAVDEAQEPTKSHLDYFRSYAFPNIKRPAMSMLIRAITGAHVPLIIAGTGMSLVAIRDAVRSSVAEEDLSDEIQDIGAFETKEEQQRYLNIYVPKEILNTNHWNVLASRMAYWLRGRCEQRVFRC